MIIPKKIFFAFKLKIMREVFRQKNQDQMIDEYLIKI